MFLLNYWKFGAGALAAFALSFILHSCDVSRIKSNYEDDLKNQKKALIQDCRNDKKITSEVSNAIQNDFNAIDDQLSALRVRHYNTPTVLAVAEPTARNDAGQPKGEGISKRDGLNASKLLELAAKADKERAQRRSCQKFVRDTWKAKGQ